ncbi:MAG: 30S ribosomal protein S17 [Microgenomates group bacterium]
MKILEGVVTSTKMKKTATVLVERFKVHPLYKKRVKVKKKYHAHDQLGVKVGDRVKIQECRPISKTKRWKIIEKLT